MTTVTYKDSGVDIDKADRLKRELKDTLSTNERRVLNTVGAFSALFDLSALEGISQPVLCLKMEEPGSKQLLAAQHGKLESVGEDLVNHLINDTIMNGGRPLAMLDTIVCGKLDAELVGRLIKRMADSAKRERCVLVGGETSEQPRVLGSDRYILSAACVGVVDRSRLIDGSKISVGDHLLGVASNGAHTNGYTLIRTLLEKRPDLAETRVGDISFLDAVLLPHRCYNTPLQEIFSELTVHGLAHITGGGIIDNTVRVLPKNVDSVVDLSSVKVPELFSVIQRAGDVPHDDMLRTFNCGVGMVLIAPEDVCKRASQIFATSGIESYVIGKVERGSGNVATTGRLHLKDTLNK